jgi:hypothetical protein
MARAREPPGPSRSCLLTNANTAAYDGTEGQRSAIRGCDGVRRLASATTAGVGGHRGCRWGTAGRRGRCPHRAAPRRRFLADGPPQRARRRRGLRPSSSRPRAGADPCRHACRGEPPCRWTCLGPAPGRWPCESAARWHRAAPGRLGIGAGARAARSRMAGRNVVAGPGTSSVLLYACLLWRALTEACTLERIDRRRPTAPVKAGLPGPALVASLPGPLPPTLSPWRTG